MERSPDKYVGVSYLMKRVRESPKDDEAGDEETRSALGQARQGVFHGRMNETLETSSYVSSRPICCP